MNEIQAFRFDNPLVLIGLAGLIPVIILAFLHYRRYRPDLGAFRASPGMERELRLRYVCSCLAFGLFLASLIIALAGPRWGRRIVPEYRRGVDVVLALDVSRSMEVREGDISRLDRALLIAHDFAEHAEGRLGAAIGKGIGVLAVPLTYDTGAVLTFLEGLTGSAVTGRGTNLETLIDAASRAFQTALPARQVIVLFSDGESLSGSLSAAIDRVLEAGITLVAVGMGSETGGPVPQALDPLSPEGAPLDTRGIPPISYRRGEILRGAAERTGGRYVDGNREDAVPVLTAYIRSLTPEAGVSGYHLETRPRQRLFILIALLFLGVSKGCEKRRKKLIP
ncbi:MAG: VWA domain-containing protein [Treponema sp.]|nr:VWA domain-containing protein [Treponema sp.]